MSLNRYDSVIQEYISTRGLGTGILKNINEKKIFIDEANFV